MRRVRLSLLSKQKARHRRFKRLLRTLDRRASSAGVALEDSQGRVLVVKATYKDYWSFPGGIVDAGETPLAAAARECREEVSVTIDPARLQFLFVVNRISQLALTYQFIFGGCIDDDQKQRLVLDGKEIISYEFVTKRQVAEGDRPYAQSVVLWARDFRDGYSEQQFGAGLY